MELLEAHQITRYQRGEPLFQPLDLRLRSGTRLGVVGPNGCGKSTLLAVLAGTLPADEGRLLRRPGVRLAHLPQDLPAAHAGSVWSVAATGLSAVREAEARLRHEERRLAAGESREDALADALAAFEALGAYRAEAGLRAVLAALGFGEDAYGFPAARLSGGERRRLALAASLAGTPDVLLLDEPTNHLDIAARAWLAERLARWPGALVLVSHDRALLDGATNATLFLGQGAPEFRRGGFERASRAREQALHALRRRDAERSKEARRLRAMTEALAARGDRGASRRRRAADRKAAALAALAADSDATAGASEVDLALGSRGLQGVLLEGTALERRGVVAVPRVRLLAGRRIALVGPNGSGKSTLLGLLEGSIPSDDARAELHYAPRLRLAALTQLERGLASGEPILAQLERVAGASEARRLLSELGVRAARWELAPERLSGGERARAGLALLQAREADLLLLDEPTNDLDLPAIEALERALRASPAAAVIATHDRRLVEHVADEVWALEDGQLRAYGNVAAYLSGAGAGDPATVPDPVDGAQDERTAPPPSAGERGARGLEALEDEARYLDRVLEDPLLLAPRRLERLLARRAALQDELALAYDARLEPPAPRFRVREHGLIIVADRDGDGLLVLAADEAAAPRAMTALRRVAAGTPEAGDEAAVGGRPWAQLTKAGNVAHVALREPHGACLLPWARVALADGAARLAFTLLDVSAVQLFSRAPLDGTQLQDAGNGWWTWTRAAFARREGLPECARDAPASRRDRTRRRGGSQRSRPE